MENMNWYCKPASFEEACEIVDRATHHGALKADTVKGSQQPSSVGYEWDFYDCWGVDEEGCTRTIYLQFIEDLTILTIDQVRQHFPLPSDDGQGDKGLLESDMLIPSLKLLRQEGLKLTGDQEWLIKASEVYAEGGCGLLNILNALKSGRLPPIGGVNKLGDSDDKTI